MEEVNAAMESAGLGAEDKNNSQIAPSEDDENDKRDGTTKQRESFLSIYKEDNGNDGEAKSDEPDLSNGIRFKREAEEDDTGFELKTGPDGSAAGNAGGKPLIQELNSKETEVITKRKAQEKAIAEKRREEEE